MTAPEPTFWRCFIADIRRNGRALLKALPFAVVYAWLTVSFGRRWLFVTLLIPPLIWHCISERKR